MRAAEAGLQAGRLPAGPLGAITDVAGVGVGHANADPDHTGVTAIVPRLGDDAFVRPYAAAVACLNGAGEIAGFAQLEEWGVAETPIFLTGTSYVGAVYDGATRVLEERQPRIGRDDVVIPVVAECDPTSFCDLRDGHRPDVADVRAALDAAAGGPVAEGQVGAGVGMSCFGWAGGIGTASRRAGGYTVGVLVLANFGDPPDLCVAGHPVGRQLPAPAEPGNEGSCVCVVATDAPLAPFELRRLARRPFLGLARTGSYASHGSGEVAIAFSTGNREAFARDAPEPLTTLQTVRGDAITPLFAAAVEAAEDAVLNALLAGRELRGATGATLAALPLERMLALVRAS